MSVFFLLVGFLFSLSRAAIRSPPYDVRITTAGNSNSGSSSLFYIAVHGTSGLWTDHVAFDGHFSDKSSTYILANLGVPEWNNLQDVGDLDSFQITTFETGKLEIDYVSVQAVTGFQVYDENFPDLDNNNVGKCDRLTFSFTPVNSYQLFQASVIEVQNGACRTSASPTMIPTANPATPDPSLSPTTDPTASSNNPTISPTSASVNPSVYPTRIPTNNPVTTTTSPTASPSSGSGEAKTSNVFSDNDELLYAIIALLAIILCCMLICGTLFLYKKFAEEEKPQNQNMPSNVQMSIKVNSASQNKPQTPKEEENNSDDGVLATHPVVDGPKPTRREDHLNTIQINNLQTGSNNVPDESPVPVDEIVKKVDNEKNKQSNLSANPFEIPSDDEDDSLDSLDKVVLDDITNNNIKDVGDGDQGTGNPIAHIHMFTGDYKNRKLQDWTLEDVRSFLKDSGLSKEYSYQFGLKGIDGKTLVMCKIASDLENIGVAEEHSQFMIEKLNLYRLKQTDSTWNI